MVSFLQYASVENDTNADVEIKSNMRSVFIRRSNFNRSYEVDTALDV